VAVEAQEVENGTNGEGSENFVVLPLATRTTGNDPVDAEESRSATTDDPQGFETAADHTASAARRPLGGRYRHCTKPVVDSDLTP
jgi:hypothetical protein